MRRKTRFLVGFVLVTAVFALPIAITITVNAISWLAIFIMFYFGSVYQVYRMTLRNIKLKYPMLNPEGHPDIYSDRMPRPIYEDMEQYPWFFRKKRKKVANKTRKIRKKQ